MSLIDASMLMTAVFFALYGIASSVEAGIALSFLMTGQTKIRHNFTPLWEVANVFLVFGLILLAMLFNTALERLSSALMPTILVGLGALIIRACAAFTIFYWRSKKMPEWLTWVFTLSCYLFPLSFASAGAYMFTGQLFWHSFTGWLVMVAAALGITAMGLVTMNNDRNESSLLSNELIFTAWLLVLGSALPLSAKIAMPHIQKTPMMVLSLLSIIGLVSALIAINKRDKFKLWRFGVGTAFAAPILLAWANRPYLIAGKMTLAEAFGASAYAKAFLVGIAVIVPLAALSFWLIWRRLINRLAAG